MSTVIDATYRVPAQSGVAVEVPSGATIVVVDVDGKQVADTFAFTLSDPTEWLSTDHTRTVLRRVVIRPGDTLVSNKYRPMLTVVDDTSPGVHDALYPACDDEMYHRLGAGVDHPSCYRNFHRAIELSGHPARPITSPFNLYQNSVVDETGTMITGDAVSRPGDCVTLRARMAMLLVVTACSQDVVTLNGDRCTDIAIHLRGASR